MKSAELTLLAETSEVLAPESGGRKSDDSILYWTKVYWETEVDGSPDGTVRAKRADLELFLNFFAEVVGSDHVDYWTPSVSKSFRTWLQTANPVKPGRRHLKAYAPTSINRTLATLRHFARCIETRRKFEAGFPMKDVTDLDVKEPEWHGLSDIQLMRLRAALDQITQLSTRGQQMPRRNRAVFVVALDTGLRAFELESLEFEQYQGRYLRRVKGKGHAYADVYLSADARKELDAYIDVERGREPGPLFVTNRGGRLSRQQVDRFLRRVAAHANSKLPAEEHIRLHTHMLRHTSTKKVYQARGPVEAKKFGRHRSFKQLERYATQTQEEHEEMVDRLWT